MSAFSVFKKAFKFFEPFKGVLATIVLLSLVQNIFSHLGTYFIGATVDFLIADNRNLAITFFAIYIFVRSLPILLSRIRVILELKNFEFSFFHFAENESLRKSLGLSLGQIKKEHSGFKQDVIKSGIGSLDYLRYAFLDEVIPTISVLLVAFVGLFIISPSIFIASVIVLTLYFIYNYFANKMMKEPLKEIIKRKIERNKNYLDLLQNLFFIKFNNQKNTAIKIQRGYQNRFQDFAVDKWMKYHKTMFVSDFILISFGVISGFLAFRGISNGSISIGMLVPIFAWIVSISQQLNRVRNIHRRTTVAIADLEKMFTMLEQESDVPIAENAKRIKKFEKNIVFENVSFDYHDGKKDALLDIDIEIKKNEKVALVGKSGSGKSTILSMLLRLYDPSFGSLIVDGNDLRMIDLEDWHNLIAYVPQDGDLLDISIKENVLFGAKNRSSESKIIEALKRAEAYDFVQDLPDGINTVVGERGVKLSGGQKQRICIARALVKDAPILILDEATSSLDSETEKFLNKNIWDILKGKTGIVIAHRLSTILDADRIIVMDNGAVVGNGPHKELLKTCSFYKRLVDAQNISF